ncbi:MAG: leucyl/phenylalanyl-tRNA--protein transferase [Rhodobacter sp.]|nr:leucyl/phenylalanyl-tRNA--protein transferase [Rhodobacter sp.]
MRPPELTPEMLIQAYAAGIFPMAEAREADEVFWVDPEKRGILPLDGFHISRSLARSLRRGDYHVTIDRDFPTAVAACADRPETWINATIQSLYAELHSAGLAHSLEVWHADEMTGAVYGVTLGGAFFGESMFSRRTDASKIALAYLVDHLRRTGFQLFDAQFITPHLASLGAVEISRAAYHERLRAALDAPADFLSDMTIPTAQDVIQRNTQTS